VLKIIKPFTKKNNAFDEGRGVESGELMVMVGEVVVRRTPPIST
jgi:hypothetical protein